MRINWKKSLYFSWRRKFFARFKLKNGVTLSAIQSFDSYSHNTKQRIAKCATHVEIGFFQDGELMRFNKVVELFPEKAFADVWPDESVTSISVKDLKRFVKKYLR